jgi:hypothetical protein
MLQAGLDLSRRKVDLHLVGDRISLKNRIHGTLCASARRGRP